MSQDARSAQRPAADQVLVDIADYALTYRISSEDAYRDRVLLPHGLARLRISGAEVSGLYQIARTSRTRCYDAGWLARAGHLVRTRSGKAAFNIGTMIRWLDFNDTWLAAEWGHPSDNLGAILAVADYLSRRNAAQGKRPLVVRDVLTAMIKAHEIQGVMALENSFNRVGLDHVLLVRVASTAVATSMLGGTRDQVINAVSNAWVGWRRAAHLSSCAQHRLAQELGSG